GRAERLRTVSRLTESNPLLSGKRPRSLGALTYASHSDDGLTHVSVGEDSCGLSRTRDVRTKPSISHRQSSAAGFSTHSVGTYSAVACTMLGLLSVSSPLMAQANIRQALQVTGQPTSVMPKTNATPDMLKVASVAAPAAQGDPTFGNGPAPGPLGSGPGCNLFPAPPSTGASVPLSYFGPPPSASNPSLVGPYQLLQSGHVDAAKGTITLPLYKGYMKKGNAPVWYILTDVSDPTVATLLGLNPSAKLTNAGPGARTANFNSNGDLIFDAGKVDFSPERALVSGPSSAPFPPAVFRPGSIGDANYGPLVRVLNAGGIFYNAPIVAFGVDESQINFPNGNVDYSKVHDQVLAIDPFGMTVTFQLINGFSFGHPLW